MGYFSIRKPEKLAISRASELRPGFQSMGVGFPVTLELFVYIHGSAAKPWANIKLYRSTVTALPSHITPLWMTSASYFFFELSICFCLFWFCALVHIFFSLPYLPKILLSDLRYPIPTTAFRVRYDDGPCGIETPIATLIYTREINVFPPHLQPDF